MNTVYFSIYLCPLWFLASISFQCFCISLQMLGCSPPVFFVQHLSDYRTRGVTGLPSAPPGPPPPVVSLLGGWLTGITSMDSTDLWLPVAFDQWGTRKEIGGWEEKGVRTSILPGLPCKVSESWLDPRSKDHSSYQALLRNSDKACFLVPSSQGGEQDCTAT